MCESAGCCVRKCVCVHVFAGACEVLRASPNIHHYLAGKTGIAHVTERLHNLAVDSHSAETKSGAAPYNET